MPSEYMDAIGQALSNWGRAIMPNKTADEYAAEEMMMNKRMKNDLIQDALLKAYNLSSGQKAAGYEVGTMAPQQRENLDQRIAGQEAEKAGGLVFASKLPGLPGNAPVTPATPVETLSPDVVQGKLGIEALKQISNPFKPSTPSGGGRNTLSLEAAYSKAMEGLTKAGGKFGNFKNFKPSDDNIVVLGEAIQNSYTPPLKWTRQEWADNYEYLRGKLVAVQNRAQGK